MGFVARRERLCHALARSPGEVDGALGMAMEYVDGVTLGDAVRGAERFDEIRAAAIGEQIAAALSAGTGVLVGTPAYMSPEQIEGHPLDGRSDLHALGLILYEMVSGTHPFDARTPVQWVLQHLQTPPPPLAERVPNARISAGFDAVIRRCLAKRPNERFESAEQVRRALAELVDRGESAGRHAAHRRRRPSSNPASRSRTSGSVAPSLPTAPRPLRWST